jgi:hypothetical protein
MKILLENAKHIIGNAYFWQRLLTLSVSLFFFTLFLRISNDSLTTVFFIASMASSVWLIFALFKKQGSKALGSKPIKPLWLRLVATVTLVPALLVLSPALGFGMGLAINPYTAEEVAANEAREAAEKIKIEEQAKRDEIDRAAREELENQKKEDSGKQDPSDSDKSTESTSNSDARSDWEAQMESDGWEQAQAGIWFQWAEEYSCSYFNCTYAFVAVEEVCARGVFVEVTIERDGVSIGKDIEITSALVPEGNNLALAELEFTDTSNSATTWKAARIYCMG